MSRNSDSANSDVQDRSSGDPHAQVRVRAAWLYHVNGMTQSEVADRLGVNRIMITRLLAEARRRGEVVIRIRSGLAQLVEIQSTLEDRFGLSRAIVAPNSDPNGDPTRTIAAAAGAYVSEFMASGMTVGVGWGRTLHTMLQFTEGRTLKGVRVVSLLGGISQARRFNPAEFAWRFAELFDAEGFLIPAPSLVDSARTKRALLERCGLEQTIAMAESCDAALLSCGGITPLCTSYSVGRVSEDDRRSLVESGAVGDILCNFLDRDGRLVDHPVNERSVSVSVESLARMANKVLISGGAEKTEILKATLRSLRPCVLVTDEFTATRLLGLEA